MKVKEAIHKHGKQMLQYVFEGSLGGRFGSHVAFIPLGKVLIYTRVDKSVEKCRILLVGFLKGE